MKRPLFTVGIAYLAAMAVAFYFDYAAAMLMVPILAFALILIIDDKSKSGKVFVSILISGIVALTVSVGFTMIRYAPVASLYGKTVIIKGTIIKQEQNDNVRNYRIRAKIKGLNLIGSDYTKIDLKAFAEWDIEAGDAVELQVKLSDPMEHNQNRGYYLSNGIFSSGFISTEPIILKNPIHPVLSFAVKYREKLMDSINEFVPNGRGDLINTVLFGEKYEMDETIRQSFNRSGISHILAISGLHLSILVNIVLSGTTAFLSRKKSCFVSIIVAWIFVVMGGMGYSLIRSAIMLTVYLLGNIMEKESDGLSSLGLAGIVMVTINPFAIGSVSMQMSFLATLGILALAEPIDNAIHNHLLYKLGSSWKKLDFVVKIVSITLAAQIAVSPIIILKFGFISLIAPLTNLLIAPVVPLVLVTGLLTAFSGALGLHSILSSMFGNITAVGIEVIIKISDFLAEVPGASVYIRKTYIVVWLAAMFAAALALYLIKAHIDTIRYAAMLGILSLLVGMTSNAILNINTVNIIAFNDSPTVAVIKNNRAVLIGMPQNKYTAKRVIERLDSFGVDALDMIMVTGADNIRGTGTPYMLENKEVHYIVAPEDEYVNAYLKTAANAKIFPFTNMRIIMLGNIECDLITHWGINIKVNGNNILKIFDDYDIIKGKDAKASALIDSDGITYIKERKSTVRNRKTLDGDQIFTLRE